MNYLARLGWSHGDDEVFSMQQFCEWFDLDHITPSAAQFNTEKLNWLNNHYIKAADLDVLVKDITKRLARMDIEVTEQPNLKEAIVLYRDRANTLNELAHSVGYFYAKPTIDTEAKDKHLTADVLPVLKALATQLAEIAWTSESILSLIHI